MFRSFISHMRFGAGTGAILFDYWPVMALKQFSQVVQAVPIQICTAPMIMCWFVV